jgi:hypothetical protein
VERVLAFAPTSGRLTRRCWEIALELNESGYAAEVAEILSRLPEA